MPPKKNRAKAQNTEATRGGPRWSKPFNLEDFVDTSSHDEPEVDDLPGWYLSDFLAARSILLSRSPTSHGTFKISLRGLNQWVMTVVDALIKKLTNAEEPKEVSQDQIVLAIVRSTCLALAQKLLCSYTPIDGDLRHLREILGTMMISLPFALSSRINSFGPVNVDDNTIYHPKLEGIWISHFVNLALRKDADILETYKQGNPLLHDSFPSFNADNWALFVRYSHELAHSEIFPIDFEAQLSKVSPPVTIRHGYELDPGKVEIYERIEFSKDYASLRTLRQKLESASTVPAKTRSDLITEVAVRANSWSTKFTVVELKHAIKECVGSTVYANRYISNAIEFVRDVGDVFFSGGKIWQLMSYNEGCLSGPVEFSMTDAIEAISLQWGVSEVIVPADIYKFPNPFMNIGDITTKRREMLEVTARRVLKRS